MRVYSAKPRRSRISRTKFAIRPMPSRGNALKIIGTVTAKSTIPLQPHIRRYAQRAASLASVSDRIQPSTSAVRPAAKSARARASTMWLSRHSGRRANPPAWRHGS
jgi:hypothetical protein